MLSALVSVDYLVKKSVAEGVQPRSSVETVTAQSTKLVQQPSEQASEQAPQRNENGQWLPGECGNRGGRRKRPITTILQTYINSEEGQKAILKAARSQVRTSEYQSSMAQYIRETLEGKLVERVEVAGGLELSARIARARKRLAEADNTEEHSGESE